MPLLEQQRVQQVLADVATEIEAARLLVWRAAWMGRNGIPMTGGQGSMSKLKAGDVAMWATTTLMDLVGPYAQTTDCPLEKFFRDAKIYQLFEGTAQVQRLVISRMQRADYQRRIEEAAEVLEQAPGNAPGEPVAALSALDTSRTSAGLDRRPWPPVRVRQHWRREVLRYRASARDHTPCAERSRRTARRQAGGPAAGPRLAERSRGGWRGPALGAPGRLARLSWRPGAAPVASPQ